VWCSNYGGGLLILAWLLDDLAKRLSAAIAILHAPRLDRLLARVPALSCEMTDRLRVILAPAAARRPKGRRSWRSWIDTLPESGNDLRERALGERYNCGASVCSRSRPSATERRSRLWPRASASLRERSIVGCTRVLSMGWKPPWNALDADRN